MSFFIILIVVLGIWSSAPFFLNYLQLHSLLPENVWKQELALFGDSFGAVNALFSGLGFAAVYYALRLQSQQLKLQQDELTNQQELHKAYLEHTQLHYVSVKYELLSGLIDKVYAAINNRKRLIEEEIRFEIEQARTPGDFGYDSSIEQILYEEKNKQYVAEDKVITQLKATVSNYETQRLALESFMALGNPSFIEERIRKE